MCFFFFCFFFSSRRRHTRCSRDWSSDVCSSDLRSAVVRAAKQACLPRSSAGHVLTLACRIMTAPAFAPTGSPRSEEYTSELQSRLHLVCRLLLEKKKICDATAIVVHRQV